MYIVLKPFEQREPKYIIEDLKDTDTADIPTFSGAYIIVSTDQRFIYPNGKSKVIYIGKADNMRNRLQTHKKHLEYLLTYKKSERTKFWWYSRYHYFAKFGCKVFCFQVKGTQSSKNLENLLLEDFYDTYHSLPVGNGAISFRV